MSQWRNELLKDIKVLTTSSAGRILVFKEHAEPILTGTRDVDVVLAAAQYGKGRIVAVAHDTYVGSFVKDEKDASKSILHSNIKSWVSNGKFTSNSDIGNLAEINPGTEQKYKIVFLAGGNGGKIKSDDVLKFVENGGGFVIGLTPWGWLQGQGASKTIDDAPYADVLKKAGLYYLDEVIYPSNAVFNVSANKASDAHLLRLLKSIPNGNLKELAAKSLLFNQLSQVPEQAKDQEWNSTAQAAFKYVDDKIRNEKWIPTDKTPMKDSQQLAAIKLWLPLYKQLGSGAAGIEAPGHEQFPGEFSTPPTSVTSDAITVTSDKGTAVYPTGFYAAAGSQIKVEVLNLTDAKGWSVQIGPNFCSLSDKDSLQRWPNIQISAPLAATVTTLQSPFGGTVYFSSPSKLSTLKVKLSNVVPSPRFQLDVPGEVEKWKATGRNLPGLWADFEGKHVIITSPSSSIRNLQDPTDVLKFWDKLLVEYHDLRGTNIDAHRREWFIPDKQPCVGYMHAGYPIVTHLDVFDPKNNGFVFNYDRLKTDGTWGLFHEFGHNMQRGNWTLPDCGEISNNIFSLFAMDVMTGHKPWIAPWLKGQVNGAKTFLQNDKPWPNSPGTGLFFYAQLARDFTWDSYRKVFRQYEALKKEEQPKTGQDEIDLWFVIFSKTVGYNLSPLALFWKIPLTDKVNSQIGSLPAFLPDDEFTSASSRTAEILKKFPNIQRKPAAANVKA